MLSETGRVVAVEESSVWVETIRQTSCGSCAAQKGCGHGLLNSISDRHRNFIRVLPGEANPSSCQIDDEVRIGIPEELLLRGSLLVYMLPLVSMLTGAGLGAALNNGDLPAVVGAVLGLAAGAGLLRLHAWRHRDDLDSHPVLLEILRPGVVSVAVL